MHYCTEIWIPTNENVETQIEEILKPYDENTEDENYLQFEKSEDCENCEKFENECIDGDLCGYYKNNDGIIGYDINPNGLYDWFMIGGRYSGHKIKGYNPREDPNNHEKCPICNGTGFRGILICNSCGNYDETTKSFQCWEIRKGISVSWPTNWDRLDVNISDVNNINNEAACYSIIYKDIVKIAYRDKLKKFIDEHKIENGYFVTVDCHY